MRCQIASIAQMGEVIKGLVQYAEMKIPMSEENSYYLRLILSELITNSFKHGGCANKAVRVEVGVRSDALEICVEDGGRGIVDHSAIGLVPDATAESGRGLAIVKGLCSSLELNESGNCVTARLSVH